MGQLYVRDGRYGIDYRDHRGQRIRKVVASDKSVALTILADAMKAVEKMKAGVLQADPREGKKAIDVQIDAYLPTGPRSRGRRSFPGPRFVPRFVRATGLH